MQMRLSLPPLPELPPKEQPGRPLCGRPLRVRSQSDRTGWLARSAMSKDAGWLCSERSRLCRPHLEDAFDLDRHAVRQAVGADGDAGVPAGIAENLDHQVRAA